MSSHSTPLLLIDGSSYLYRAFYAAPPLTNAKGEPTGAIYGVINMIRSLIHQYQPSHIAVIFDAKGGSTARQALYTDYKATRQAMPDDLQKQIEPLHQILIAMGLPLLCVDHVEADDVIGTLAKQAEKENRQVLISTGDKDMAQLVSPTTSLLNTMTNVQLDEAGVLERFGVPPSKIIDFLALMGDSSDNIPGVPGVGEKTAVALLSHFDHLDDLYARIDEVLTLPIRGAKSLHKKLIEHEALARLSYQLATIHVDLALDRHYDQLRLTSYDANLLLPLFQELNFKRWVTELEQGTFIKQTASKQPVDRLERSPAEPSQSAIIEEAQPNRPKHYHTITTDEALSTLIQQLSTASLIAFDTETDSVDPFNAQLVGLSFATQVDEAFYIPLQHRLLDVQQLPLASVLEQLKPIFEDNNLKKVGQNCKFDVSVLANYGIQVQGVEFDTMLESYVLDSQQRHDLDSLALRHLNHKCITYDDVVKVGNKKLTIDHIEIETVSEYACEDADITLQLHHTLWPQIEAEPVLKSLFETIEMPLSHVLTTMERTGVCIDETAMHQQSSDLSTLLMALEQEIHTLAQEPFNINSPKQLQTILFDKLQLPALKKTPKGAPSTNEDVLSELAKSYPLPKLILEYRGYAKLKNTYTDKLPLMISSKDQRIHTHYNQVGTITGRLSSNDPNLQNIPIRNEAGRRIRQAFIAPAGYQIVSADYSQIELRIMAHLSQDPSLIQAFKENRDIHTATAAEILEKEESAVTNEERRRAKAVNFGLIYGMSAFGLAKQIDLSRHEAQFYIDRYFDRYPKVLDYMETMRQFALEHGYVETLLGRRLYLPKINARNGLERKGAERAAINAPMQGTAADIIKRAMISIQNKIEHQSEQNIQLLMQVHDELVFEIQEEALEHWIATIKTEMENAISLKVPLLVAIGAGKNWDQAH